MKPTQKMRQLLNQDGILIVPGAADALVARIIEQAGFPAVYMSGAGVSYLTLGKPDVGLITMSEMVQKAAYLAEAVSVPVIADADTGYGGILNIKRTVTEFERAGVAGIQIEDQVMPKKCGHLRDKQVVSREEALARVKAALDARRDPDFIIIARTDARAVLGLGEALERGRAFAEAGADVIFVEAPQSVEEMRAITTAIDKPTLANMVEGGKTPLTPAAELANIGYKMVIFPNSTTRMMAKAATKLMAELKLTGTTTGLLPEMMNFTELNQLLGLQEVEQLDKRYEY
ncbi:isocitrate lyase/phosphoenolpyruvate mutase family protein [Desulfallas sp. Bu1-1]|uniref:isocitrate lyase/PEP mutase family protein n=1 Tax=Desulfallas sp. Bu1-1 TaxID=2787620 RepID=UPI00189CE89A|nr:isocitrate lyase/phosphoenolpyruvate mutase family protein [Desulfallas sp. Bu1-1]MBF7084609.1 isocitrate lyase/phosphoenolpyruvate mutase family protein [Desulfallas sp. Bu1-1]